MRFRSKERDYSADILEYGAESLQGHKETLAGNHDIIDGDVFELIPGASPSGNDEDSVAAERVYSSANTKPNVRSKHTQQEILEQRAAEYGVTLPDWLKVVPEPAVISRTAHARHLQGRWMNDSYLDSDLTTMAINNNEIRSTEGRADTLTIIGEGPGYKKPIKLHFLVLDHQEQKQLVELEATQIDIPGALVEGNFTNFESVYMVKNLPSKLESIFNQVGYSVSSSSQELMTRAFDQAGSEVPKTQLEPTRKPVNPLAGTADLTRNNYAPGSFMDEVRQRAIDGLFGTSTYEASQTPAAQPGLEISDEVFEEVVDREFGPQTTPQPRQARRVAPAESPYSDDEVMSAKPIPERESDIDTPDEKAEEQTSERVIPPFGQDAVPEGDGGNNFKDFITNRISLDKRPSKRTLIVAAALIAAGFVGISKMSPDEAAAGSALDISATKDAMDHENNQEGATSGKFDWQGHCETSQYQADGKVALHAYSPADQAWFPQDSYGASGYGGELASSFYVDVDSSWKLNTCANAPGVVTYKENKKDDGDSRVIVQAGKFTTEPTMLESGLSKVLEPIDAEEFQSNEPVYGKFSVEDAAQMKMKIDDMDTGVVRSLANVAILTNLENSYGEALSAAFQDKMTDEIVSQAEAQGLQISEDDVVYKGQRPSALSWVLNKENLETYQQDNEARLKGDSVSDYRLYGTNDSISFEAE